MKKHVSIIRPLTLILVLPLLTIGGSSVYAAQQSDPPATDKEEAARAKLAGGGTLAEKVARAEAKSEDVQAIARERGAAFASAAAGLSAAQLRGRLPGNAQVAKVEGRPCDQPAVSPPQDAAALCKPGEH